MPIHQVLHGYRRGHELLAASLSLGNEGRFVMLQASDLSGRDAAAGFDSYLTGYPLPTESAYVIARTWVATEMPRPGSVWTHSLLLDEEALRSIGDFRSLLRLFKRPAVDGFTDYEMAAEGDFPPAAIASVDQQTRSRLIDLLCGAPDRDVVLTSAAPGSVEPEVLWFFNEQWDDLRWKFAFCTGALSPRDIPGVRFDLQIIPERASARAEWRELIQQSQAIGTWRWSARMAADEFIPGGFGEFAAAHGASMEASRTSFAALANGYFTRRALIDREAMPDDLVKAASAPEIAASQTALSAVLQRIPDPQVDSALLAALSNAPYAQALNPSSLAVSARLKAIAEDIDALGDVVEASVLARRPSAFARATIELAAPLVNEKAMLVLMDTHPAVIPALVQSRRSLALMPELWLRGEESALTRLLDVLSSPPGDQPLLDALARVLVLVTPRTNLASAALSQLGPMFAASVLGEFDRNKETRESQRLFPWLVAMKSAFRSDQLAILLDSERPPAAAMIVFVLGPGWVNRVTSQQVDALIQSLSDDPQWPAFVAVPAAMAALESMVTTDSETAYRSALLAVPPLLQGNGADFLNDVRWWLGESPILPSPEQSLTSRAFRRYVVRLLVAKASAEGWSNDQMRALDPYVEAVSGAKRRTGLLNRVRRYLGR